MGFESKLKRNRLFIKIFESPFGLRQARDWQEYMKEMIPKIDVQGDTTTYFGIIGPKANKQFTETLERRFSSGPDETISNRDLEVYLERDGLISIAKNKEGHYLHARRGLHQGIHIESNIGILAINKTRLNGIVEDYGIADNLFRTNSFQ